MAVSAPAMGDLPASVRARAASDIGAASRHVSHSEGRSGGVPMSWRGVACALSLTGALGATTSPARADGVDELAALSAQVSALVDRRDYKALDALEEQVRPPSQRLALGRSRLAAFNETLSRRVSRSVTPACDEGEKQFGYDWLKASPHSRRAILAVANGLIAEAWCARGGGFAPRVKAEAGPVFTRKLEEAERFLLVHKAEASPNGLWYYDMLFIYIGLSRTEEEFRRLASEALEVAPLYERIPVAVATYYLPKWYGSYQALDAAAQWLAERNRPLDGGATYASVYWQLFSANPAEMTRVTHIDWRLMRASMRAIVGAFPDRGNFESLARISCANGDWLGSVFFSRHLPAAPPTLWSPWNSPGEREVCLQSGVIRALAERRDEQGQPVPLPKVLPPPTDVPTELIN